MNSQGSDATDRMMSRADRRVLERGGGGRWWRRRRSCGALALLFAGAGSAVDEVMVAALVRIVPSGAPAIHREPRRQTAGVPSAHRERARPGEGHGAPSASTCIYSCRQARQGRKQAEPETYQSRRRRCRILRPDGIFDDDEEETGAVPGPTPDPACRTSSIAKSADAARGTPASTGTRGHGHRPNRGRRGPGRRSEHAWPVLAGGLSDAAVHSPISTNGARHSGASNVGA